MNRKQIERLGEEKLRNIYNNIIATHNLVNIQQVEGKDLEIKDTNEYDYILSYSFPCQDLSIAGKGKGMSDTSTRSGMLWEVERILYECKEIGNLPQILLMENVPQVHSQDNMKDFLKWQSSLEKLGYKNYWQDLIATDYGIPQIRNRCFMISILGDYNYTFPQKQELKLKLKDLLEDKVDEKYYLSDTMKKFISSNNDKYIGNNNYSYINKINASTITTREGNTRCDTSNYICNQVGENYNLKKELCNKLIEENLVKENDVIRHSYSNSRLNKWNERNVETNNISPTLDTRCDCLGVVNNLRIRKLTPKECFRLMGVKDEDFEKCAKNQSNSSLYHLAGDSIVVNVLMAIYKQFDL